MFNIRIKHFLKHVYKKIINGFIFKNLTVFQQISLNVGTNLLSSLICVTKIFFTVFFEYDACLLFVNRKPPCEAKKKQYVFVYILFSKKLLNKLEDKNCSLSNTLINPFVSVFTLF